MSDNTKNNLYKSLVVIFYLSSFLILIYCIKVRLTPNIYLPTKERLILLFIVCILIHIGGYILVKKLKYNKMILKVNLIIYFLIYTITICTLTLFDEIFGRQGFVIIRWNEDLLKMYMNSSFNIVPLKTIKLFTNGYFNDLVTFKDFSINIFGNLGAFMPYGVFLPLMFKSMRKYRRFFITMTLSVIIIELLQFVTMSGSCDIDDLILNVLGASIVFFIAKIKIVNKIIRKIFLYE